VRNTRQTRSGNHRRTKRMLRPLSTFWPDSFGPFMRHTRWSDALFMHWRVPRSQLLALLPLGLTLDDLSCEEDSDMAWIGVVLLSELGVGPAGCCRDSSCCRMMHVDHHGANVRLYVCGPDGPGVFFLSLECSSLLATAGARLMAIPYFFSSMSRDGDVAIPGAEKARCFRVRAQRRCLCCQTANSSRRGLDPAAAYVDCTWTIGQGDAGLRGSDGALPRDRRWNRRARFFVERYRVYAVQRGQLYSGTVIHRPWPVLPAQVLHLEQSLLPLSVGEPAHCCFSAGVGPVDFSMLRPCKKRSA
jgi:uncharacterized protein YqjF (DUF2071 family)